MNTLTPRPRLWALLVPAAVAIALAPACGDDKTQGGQDDVADTSVEDVDTTAPDTTAEDVDTDVAESDTVDDTSDTSDAEDTDLGDVEDTTDPDVCTMTFGTAGGALSCGPVRLVVPAGALDEDVEITIAKTDEALPGGYVGYSAIYRFTPAGLAFSVPATVTFKFLGDEDDATLLWAPGDSFDYAVITGVVHNGSLTAPVNHFSRGAVGAVDQVVEPDVVEPDEDTADTEPGPDVADTVDDVEVIDADTDEPGPDVTDTVDDAEVVDPDTDEPGPDVTDTVDDVTEPDADVDDVEDDADASEPDTDEVDTYTPPLNLELNAPCDRDVDCASGLCFGPEAARFCALECESSDACPTGWSCMDVAADDPDMICVDPDDLDGLPCVEDDECGWFLSCLEREGEGTRCALPCPAGACPGGFVCDAGACVPIGGQPCEPFHVASGAEGECERSNLLGTCGGALRCETVGEAPVCDAAPPQPEICDDVDNDCDGVTDEDLCDDANPCTDDACDILVPGGCRFTPTPMVPCDDGDVCTQADFCSANGECVGVDDVCVCETADDCVLGLGDQDETCVALDCVDNTCVVTPHAVTTPCASDNLCLGDGICDGVGHCVGQPDLCDDGNACTDDSCGPLGCIFLPTTPGTPCDDGNGCTVGDICVSGGVCLPGSATYCDDGNPCTDDACDPDVGCVFPFNDTPCDDGEDCTQDDRCRAGTCMGLVVDCSPLDSACTVGQCSPDGCVAVPIEASCDDGDPCTSGDACVEGECAGTPKDCSAADTPCAYATCSAGLCIPPQVSCSYVISAYQTPMNSVDEPLHDTAPNTYRGLGGSTGHGGPVGPAESTGGHSIHWGFPRVRK